MLNMGQSEFTFKWRLFKNDPSIRVVKKQLKYKTTGPILINHTVNKKLLFLIDRKYSTYKPGYFVTYEDYAQQRQLRIEEWVELKKDIHRLTTIAAVKNNTPEGECLKLSW
jgi:hypothetical protein